MSSVARFSKHVTIIAMTLVLSSAGARAERRPSWSVEFPLGAYAFSERNAGVTIGLATTARRGWWRLDTGLSYLRTVTEHGVSPHLHVGVSTSPKRSVTSFAVAGYRLIDIDKGTCSDGCYEYSAHVASVRAGIDVRRSSFHLAIGIELGTPFRATEIVSTGPRDRSFDGAVYGGFVRFGWELGEPDEN